MRTLLKWTFLVMACVAAVLVLPAPAHALSGVDSLHLLGPAALVAWGASGVMKFPVDPASFQELFQDANAPNAFTPEAVPYIIYDTQDFVTNWTSIDFFSTISADKSISNIEQPNSLPAEQYFRLFGITADILAGASQNDNAAAQQYNDFRIIQDTARAFVDFSIAQKLYLRIPFRALHSSGGVWAIIQGTPATNALVNTVQNFPSDGAFWVDGAIILPPNQAFTFTVRGVAAALTATRKIQIGLQGSLFRPVR